MTTREPADVSPYPGAGRRAGRRLLLGGGLAAMATGVAWAPGRAEAASGTSPWLLGGNTGVATDGSNYLGTQNAAPLVFKTAATSGSPTERMRITPTGLIGIGVAAPAAKLDVYQPSGTAVRVRAFGGAYAIAVDGIATGGTGLHGAHTATSGANPGVLGETSSTGDDATGVIGRVNPTNPGASTGVRGINNGTGDFGIGVWGSHAGNGFGVYGTSIGGYGVYGTTATSAGVIGTASDLYGTGVYGKGDGDFGVGVYGEASPEGGSVGVYGVCQQGYAGRFAGDVYVSGTLTRAGGAFHIDHPLDPERRYLQHSSVESPDMMNIYNGNVTTDSAGRATVELPDYFEVLNRDFRYQLTVIGTFAQAIVQSKITDRKFVIATDKPSVEVSWQVTGIRQDPYAEQHRIPVSSVKPTHAQGTYLHPEAYGKPSSLQEHASQTASLAATGGVRRSASDAARRGRVTKS